MKARRTRPKPKVRHRRARADSLLASIRGAEHREVGGATIDTMKPFVGTTLCMHAHVGFLVRGRVRGKYADGCAFDIVAPQAVVIEPEHDAWVVGDEAAVLVQFDAEAATTSRFGLAERHRHQ
jgi:hypothetical protein